MKCIRKKTLPGLYPALYAIHSKIILSVAATELSGCYLQSYSHQCKMGPSAYGRVHGLSLTQSYQPRAATSS